MIKRQRLYFLFPNIKICHHVIFELVAAGLDKKFIHIMAKKNTDLAGINAAKLKDRTQIKYGTILGAVVGAIAGLLSGLLVVSFPPAGIVLAGQDILLTTTLTGFGFGAVVSALIAAKIPKSELDNVTIYFEQGEVLLILDIPNNRVPDTIEAINYINIHIRLLSKKADTCT